MKSVRSKVRGQLIFLAKPIPHSKRPPRTPSRHSLFFVGEGRVETNSSILRHVDFVAHYFDAIYGGGGGVCRGIPCDHLIRPRT